jgi:hypothetical protein
MPNSSVILQLSRTMSHKSWIAVVAAFWSVYDVQLNYPAPQSDFTTACDLGIVFW